MTLLAIPLCMIYFAAGLFALFVDRKRNKKNQKDPRVTPISKPESI
jgi:Sec-independent protein secretion pathway component TatC